MAAKTSTAIPQPAAPARPAPDRTASVWIREGAGLALALAGLFLLACLVAGDHAASWVGSTGAALQEHLLVIFGRFVAFLAPAALAGVGVWLLLGRRAAFAWPRALGLGVLVFAACGLLALPGADQTEYQEATLHRAGALGVWLVNWEGLRLVGQFGAVGASLILAGAALIGIAMTAGVSLGTLLPRLPKWAVPAPRAVAEEEPEPEELVSEDDDFELAPGAPKPRRRRRLRAWLRALRSRSTRGQDTRILAELQQPVDWDAEPRDEDIAAVALALEAFELETRARERLRLWPGRREDEPEEKPEAKRAVPAPQLLDQPAEEEEPEQDEDAEWEEEGGEYELEEEEEEEKHEIVFKDHSGPLPIRSGNPANEARMGKGLAKLFPSRWPKDDDEDAADAGAPESEGAAEGDDLFDAHESRMLRRLGFVDADESEAEADAQEEAHEDDPLFNADYDTRPRGVAGIAEAEAAAFEAPIEFDDYTLPDLELLADPPSVSATMTREEIEETSDLLVSTLADFGVEGRVVEVHQGPVVTRFEFRPAPGIRVGKITGLEHDIAMAMRALSVRIMAPIPGKSAVGIEIPNRKRQGVYLKELMAHDEFWEKDSPLTAALGKTIDGSPFYCDLKKMPHLLIAGATGAGKSVCLNTVICSILYRQPPDRVRFIMVDPKRVELSVYADIPHLLAPVVCEPKCAAAALEWAVEEMEARYKKLMNLGVRNIDGYNAIAENPDGHRKTAGRRVEAMPYIVVVVDELADLMVVAKADVEESIQRLAQMARAVGIHLILATQRPSVNVITGIIKANFPSRIAFQVSQKVDSRTILDANGAENLLGRGDMLFSSGGAAKPIRIQGCFVSDEEVEHIADHCRAQMGARYEIEEFEPKLSEKEQRELARMMGSPEDAADLDAQGRIVRGTNKAMGKVREGMFVPHDGGSARAGDEEIDEALVRAAARLILESRKASVSLIQRRLKVGFARAGRLMDMLEEMGVVGEFKGSKPRDIVVDPEAALEELDRLEASIERAGGGARHSDPPTAEEEFDDEFEEDGGDDDLGDPNEPWPQRRRA